MRSVARFLPLAVVPVALVACSEAGDGTEPCPSGTIRAGLDCLVVDGGVVEDTGTTEDVAVPDVAGDTRGPDAPEDTSEDVAEPDVIPDTTPDAETDTVVDAEPDLEPDADVPLTPATFPFAADDYWAPSGFMGDGETPGAIEVTDNACDGARAGEGRGICRRFVWTRGTVGWAGIFWQYPDANWGTLPGLPVPAGASEVSFYAWGETGAEVVKFLVGIGDADGFAVETGDNTLSTEPTRYTVDLSGETVGDDVVGGFGWVSGEGEVVTFYIDDIQWR